MSCRVPPQAVARLLARASTIAALGCAVLGVGCAPCGLRDDGRLKIENLEVIGTPQPDPEQPGSLVQLRFSIIDDLGRPVRDLPPGAFEVCDDGLLDRSGEVLVRLTTQQRPQEVVLLLDASSSMANSGSVEPLKSAVRSFIDGLETSRPGAWKVVTYEFSNDLRRIDSIDDYDARRVGWTALYSSLLQVIAAHPDAVVVAFTDGADNFSSNESIMNGRVERVQDLWRAIRDRRSTVYCVGLGPVSTWTDARGFPSEQALRRIARNGVYVQAAQVDALQPAFRSLSDRITQIYDFELRSQHRTGRRELTLRVEHDGKSGLATVWYSLAGPAAPPTTSSTAPRTELGTATAIAPVRVWTLPEWAEVVESSPHPLVVTDADARGRMIATGLPWKIRHRKTGIVLLLVPPGRFMMGSPPSERSREADERQHERIIERPFYLGQTEVSQTTWRAMMGGNPSRFDGDRSHPVERVPWAECERFLQRAAGLRLPSEAEWEYACRAGTATPFSFGTSIVASQVNHDPNRSRTYRAETVPCGSLPANPWGFHEMHGNVREWCQDRLLSYPLVSANQDPVEEGLGPRVSRGGSWWDFEWNCRSADRDNENYSLPEELGFRVAADPR